MKQAHIYISGHVQGVSFRQFVKKNAQRLNLLGWVRNTSDRRVEALILGKRETIQELIDLCAKGPFLAEVTDIKAVWEEVQDSYENFQIRPSI